ncbi:MAG: hypothetical protein M3R12_03560 [Actinomycetota bacterium]|nr:hypothetical protein [Actinomycetota bacterium]
MRSRFQGRRRLVLGVVLFLALATVAAAVASVGSSRERWTTAQRRRRAGTTPGTIVGVDWEWLPPGYVCVFKARDGRELARRRPLTMPEVTA